MKVLIVYPNDRMDGLISVGVSVLSAHLKKANHEVELYDTTYYDTGKETGDFYREQMGQVISVDLSKHGVVREKKSLSELQNDFRRKVIEYNPGLIGFSVLEITYDQGLELAKAIEDLPIPVIFGGIYPTFAPKIVLKESSIDMICEGEGEEMFVELANNLEQGKDITNILNLTVKKDGKIFRSGQEVTLDDLPTGDNIYGEQTGLRRPQTHMGKTLLPPDYSIYENKRFLKKMGGKVVRTVAMELSRGCPYTCTFCCVPMQQHQHKASRDIFTKFKGLEVKEAKENDPYHREKPIPAFIEEVRDAIKNYDINFIYFTDESFLSMSSDRFEEFVARAKTVWIQQLRIDADGQVQLSGVSMESEAKKGKKVKLVTQGVTDLVSILQQEVDFVRAVTLSQVNHDLMDKKRVAKFDLTFIIMERNI